MKWIAMAAALGLGLVAPAQAKDKIVKRGAYLAQIMDCGGCHTGRSNAGIPNPAEYLAGSRLGFEIPGLGIFWPPNLTPDPTGLAAWTDAQIVKAIRKGIRPDGRQLAPIMPYETYANLTDEDVGALVAFLRTIKPVAHEAPAPVGARDLANAPFYGVIVPE